MRHIKNLNQRDILTPRARILKFQSSYFNVTLTKELFALTNKRG